MKYKFNRKFWLTVVFFGGVAVLGICVLLGIIKDEIGAAGGVIDKSIASPVNIAIAVCLCSYLLTAGVLVQTYINNKGCGFTVTDDGIENTFIVFNFLAIYLALPVRLIPWDAITGIHVEETGTYITVDKKKVRTGALGQLVLGKSGYYFCRGLVTPQVQKQDIEDYIKFLKKAPTTLFLQGDTSRF